jgi:hypothetical protein
MTGKSAKKNIPSSKTVTRANRPADICPNGHPARYQVAFGSWDCKVCKKLS